MGLMVPIALKAAEMLEAEGISAVVVNMHTVKPVSYTHLKWVTALNAWKKYVSDTYNQSLDKT